MQVGYCKDCINNKCNWCTAHGKSVNGNDKVICEYFDNIAKNFHNYSNSTNETK